MTPKGDDLDLRLCPFCGSAAIYENETRINAACPNEPLCPGSTYWHEVALWNRRVTPPAPQGEAQEREAFCKWEQGLDADIDDDYSPYEAAAIAWQARANLAAPKGEGSVPVRENILPVYCEHGYITNIIACPHCGTMPKAECLCTMNVALSNSDIRPVSQCPIHGTMPTKEK